MLWQGVQKLPGEYGKFLEIVQSADEMHAFRSSYWTDLANDERTIDGSEQARLVDVYENLAVDVDDKSAEMHAINDLTANIEKVSACGRGVGWVGAWERSN